MASLAATRCDAAPRTPPLSFHFEKLSAPRVPATPARAGQIPKNGLLVDTGSFRIDVEKALEKLQRFQLAAPEDFLLPRVRCAVANEAESVSVDRDGNGVVLRFDGRPLTPAQVQEPLSALLNEAGARG